MRIVIVSDLHGSLPKIPRCDLLLICGDICPVENHNVLFQQEWLATKFVEWINRYAPDTEVIFIAGNHDKIFERYPLPEEVAEVATYLQDSSCEFKGLKIYGTPWSQKIGKWAFSLGEKKLGNPNFTIDQDGDKHRINYHYVQAEYTLENRFALIPDDTDILITHTPPWGVADNRTANPDIKTFVTYNDFETELKADYENHWGSPSLRNRVHEIKPLIHAFGHVHTTSGIWREDGTTFINASYLDNDYIPKQTGSIQIIDI